MEKVKLHLGYLNRYQTRYQKYFRNRPMSSYVPMPLICAKQTILQGEKTDAGLTSYHMNRHRLEISNTWLAAVEAGVDKPGKS